MEARESTDARFTMSLLGARQHYAVPRALHRAGALRAFFTDLWIRPGSGKLARLLPGKAGKRLAGRYHEDLRNARVESLPFALLPGLRPGQNRHEGFVRCGRAFSRGVNRRLERLPLDPDRDVFLGFSAACLETLEFLARSGIPTIVDQVDPLCTEYRIIDEEREKWPGWEQAGKPVSARYIERVRREWASASFVLVNSAWTRDALVEQGVAGDRVVVVPQAYEGGARASCSDYDGSRPLRVLWLGSVILRKGIQYLVEAARGLRDRVEIRIAGPIRIAADKVREAPENMAFLGQVPRTATGRLFEWADVFILPTLSDGFAMTQLEAMAHGLPVITTPRCGRVVSHRENGLVIEPGSAESLQEALEALIEDPPLVGAMSRNCPAAVARFDLETYANRVLDAVKAHRSAAP